MHNKKNEDLVTFELAKKLKEKRFREKCLFRYWNYSETLHPNQVEAQFARKIDFSEFFECYNSYVDNDIDAPTISQVLKWLREEYELYLCPCVIADYQDDFHRDIAYWSFIVVNIASADSIYREYERVTEKRYETYEQAALAGIEYVLDNLI